MAVEHTRRHIRGFLSLDLCKELEFIHRSCGVVGYRPNVFSTTLSHLAATNCAHLILPFVAVREKLKEKVEDFFGCEFELFIEFTGLISMVEHLMKRAPQVKKVPVVRHSCCEEMKKNSSLHISEHASHS